MDFSGRQRQEQNPYSKPWWLVPKNMETELCSNFPPIQAGVPLNLKALVCEKEQT